MEMMGYKRLIVRWRKCEQAKGSKGNSGQCNARRDKQGESYKEQVYPSTPSVKHTYNRSWVSSSCSLTGARTAMERDDGREKRESVVPIRHSITEDEAKIVCRDRSFIRHMRGGVWGGGDERR